MKTTLLSHLQWVGLLLILCLLSALPVNAQWIRKKDALKKRSEVSSVVYNNKLYCFNGFSNSNLEIETSSEVYDPATNKWSMLASMPAGKTVTHQGVALIDNTVWHIGGRVGNNPGSLTSEIWLYNLTTNTWSRGPQLRDPETGKLIPWACPGVALVGRTLHVFGGFIHYACNSDQDKYHLTLDIDTWLANPSAPAQWQNDRKVMPVKRNHFSTTVLNGKIYALGGQFGHDCNGGQDKQYSHVYNPITDTWTELTTLPTPRSHAEGSIFPLDGKIYLVAGQGDKGVSTNKVTIFDPVANSGLGSWTENTALALPKSYEGVSAKVINNTFIISHGGEGSSRGTRNYTYTRTITRNPVYKLGFTENNLIVKVSSGGTAKSKNLLYTTESSKSYTTTSNVGWLKVTKNASSKAVFNGVDIEVSINTAGLAPGNYTGIVTANPSGTGTPYASASFRVNLTVEGTTAAVAEIHTPTEMIFSGVKGTTSPAQSVVVTNTGAGTLQINSVSITGTHASSFSLIDFSGTPLQIAAGKSASLKVVFKPSNTTIGSLHAALQLVSNDADESTVNIGLYGLSANGLQGNEEPSLAWIVKTLGHNIDVGGTGLILGTSSSPVGDEALIPSFKKAGTGPVTIKAVARYSPDDLLDFGYYTKSNGVPQLHKVATIDLHQEQTLNPKIVAGGATSFDPGTANFGFYTGSTSYASTIRYTEDELNQGPLTHAARIYPLKNRLGQPMPYSYLIAFEPAVNGDYQDYVFVVTNVTAAQQPVPTTTTLRINAGGSSFTTSDNRQFIADAYFGGTNRTYSIANENILNTTDDELYRTERSAPSFSYNMPIKNGNYHVVLHFAEIWFGAPGGREGGAGKRLFHVDIEGSRKLTDFDIFATAGGAMRAIQSSFLVAVSDGMLNINFLSGAGNMPKVSAIEVLPATSLNRAPVLATIEDKGISLGQTLLFTATATDADADQIKTFSLVDAPQGATINASTGAFSWQPAQTGDFGFTVKVTDNGSPALSVEEQVTVTVHAAATNTIRINAGGSIFIASGNRTFITDTYFGGTNRAHSIANENILNTTDDELYRTERSAPSFSYNMPIKNGNYHVVLHFAEIWFGAPGGREGGAGKRLFHVDIEGSRKLTDFDIFATAGGAMRAIQSTWPVTINDGTLNINFLRGAANFPTVAAIEVLPVTTSISRMDIGDTEEKREDFVMYPNPAFEDFTITYSSAIEQQARINIVNSQAMVVFQKDIQLNRGDNTINLGTTSFPAGVYVVQITSEKKTVVKKLVIASKY